MNWQLQTTASTQPSANQSRAQAIPWLRRTFKPSSVDKRISAFQINKTRVNTPLDAPTCLPDSAALDVLLSSPTALTKDALISLVRGRAAPTDLPAAPAGVGESIKPKHNRTLQPKHSPATAPASCAPPHPVRPAPRCAASPDTRGRPPERSARQTRRRSPRSGRAECADQRRCCP